MSVLPLFLTREECDEAKLEKPLQVGSWVARSGSTEGPLFAAFTVGSWTLKKGDIIQSVS